jgi:hypothetical protein
VGQRSEGTYILRINVRDWRDEELWRTYFRLTEAESAIRIQKFDLASQDRGHEAHVLICFLAYALWKTLQQRQSKAMLGGLAAHHSQRTRSLYAADIVLPFAQDKQRELRIRCIVRPDKSRALLLERFGLKLPERVHVPQMVQM